MPEQARERSVQCRRCGRWFVMPASRGRPPVVCTMCRPAYEAEQSTRRVRRWRQEAHERTKEEASVRERQAAYHARRLARLYPEAAAILAREVPSGLADEIIEHLKGASDERQPLPGSGAGSEGE